MKKKNAYIPAIAFAATLSACGGGGGGGSVDTPVDTRGTLLEAPAVVATVTTSEINTWAKTAGAVQAGTARCDVRVVAINYRTPGVQGEPSNVSGVLLLPAGVCADESHLLLGYGHSTDFNRSTTLAGVANGNTQLLAVMYAAQGVAVVAPDYLGYAKSSYSFHPYLHADTEATTFVDALRAGRAAAAQLGAKLSGRVLLAGYSQGAHASMAAQRVIEQSHAEEFPLAAAVHMAGAYNVSGLLQRGGAFRGYQYVTPFLLTSWQKVYGNIYANTGEAFRTPYANALANLLPSPTGTLESMIADGLLPPDVPPAQGRDLLMQPAYLARVQGDTNHPLLVAARRNDVAVGWAPRAQTLLCGGSGDPTISPALHQDTAKAEFVRLGAPAVTSIDVDTTIQALFGPGGRAPTDPTSQDYLNYFGFYHTNLEPAVCHAQARALFDRIR